MPNPQGVPDAGGHEVLAGLYGRFQCLAPCHTGADSGRQGTAAAVVFAANARLLPGSVAAIRGEKPVLDEFPCAVPASSKDGAAAVLQECLR